MTDRILHFAREMFVRDGCEAVSLRQIAHAMEYSPAAIYRYFEDKKALILAIIRRDAQDLRENLLACRVIENPVLRLLEMARRYVAWGISHPNHYRLMFVPPPTWAECDRETQQDGVPVDQESLMVLVEAVYLAIQQGYLRDEYTDPGVVAATVWASVHGVVMLEITMSEQDRSLLGESGLSLDARLMTLRSAFCNGFLRDSAQIDALSSPR